MARLKIGRVNENLPMTAFEYWESRTDEQRVQLAIASGIEFSAENWRDVAGALFTSFPMLPCALKITIYEAMKSEHPVL